MSITVLSMLSIQKRMVSYCIKDNTGGLKRYGPLLPITDVLIDEQGAYIGLIARKRNLQKTKILIPSDKIVSYTNKTVVSIGYDIINKQYLKNTEYFLSSKLINTPIKLENGSIVGFISDAYINTETSKIVAVELSRSLFEDMLNGRKLIPSFVKMEAEYNFSVITQEQLDCSFNNDKGIINTVKKHEKEL